MVAPVSRATTATWIEPCRIQLERRIKLKRIVESNWIERLLFNISSGMLYINTYVCMYAYVLDLTQVANAVQYDE